MSKRKNRASSPNSEIQQELRHRLLNYYRDSKIGFNELAEKIGTYASVLSLFFKGRRGVKTDVFVRAAVLLDFDLNELKKLVAVLPAKKRRRYLEHQSRVHI